MPPSSYGPGLAESIAPVNPKPQGVVAAMVRALASSEGGLSRGAARSLASSRQEIDRVAPILAKSWLMGDGRERVDDFNAFETLGAEGVNVLLQALGRVEPGDIDRRTATLNSVAELCRTILRVADVLVTLLRDADPRLRMLAADLLGDIRPASAARRFSAWSEFSIARRRRGLTCGAMSTSGTRRIHWAGAHSGSHRPPPRSLR